MSDGYKAGDSFHSWFDGGNMDGSSRVLEVRPYHGKYPQWFSQVLRISAPRTRQGWLEIAVGARHE